ncbi:SRPBCC family protein [Microbacterium flavum]|uniref:SRPBCC domain-containing protein n=1 Tax=Microbacterium flavum TaxID=415216 RepID=A0ABS5XVD2_9MICO|nr:SRPBCC family protein [Microbacterium flavum]MBT8797901.1 SRPBCC domain-containing protein [Microbacterium flavum]
MPVTDITTDPENLTMTLVADAAAPVERLWRAFTQPDQLSRFWGPPGWPATFTAFDLRPGGRAEYHMTSPQGQRSGGSWEVLSVDDGRSFEVLDSFVGEDGEKLEGFPSMRMVFTFASTEDGSRLTNTTYFPSHEALEQVIAMGAVEGSRMAMDQLDAVLQDLREYAQGKGTRTEILDDTHVRITRLIEGARDLVWRAHQEPELLKTWLLGPDGWQMIECEVGDTYRYVWQQGDDESTRFGFEGETVLSEPTWRAVTTEKMIGMDGPGTLNDLQLYEEDGATLLTLLIEYPSLEMRDMILATGMTEGMEASYARLEETVLANA